MQRIVIAASLGVILLAGGSIVLTMNNEEMIASGAQEAPATSTLSRTGNTDLPQAASSTAYRSVSQVLHDSLLPQAGLNGWKRAVATVFWVGEDASDENGFIHNASSAWDVDWDEHYGGFDDPDARCGFRPCAFEPRENPFYVALPYNDLDERGEKKASAAQIPWNNPHVDESVLKNRWIEVRARGKSCFGQWEDVGPFGEDDFAYVFGSAPSPRNTTGEAAGIDLSPAMQTCLGVDGSAEVLWRHVEEKKVPAGPWKEIVTTRLSQ